MTGPKGKSRDPGISVARNFFVVKKNTLLSRCLQLTIEMFKNSHIAAAPVLIKRVIAFLKAGGGWGDFLGT